MLCIVLTVACSGSTSDQSGEMESEIDAEAVTIYRRHPALDNLVPLDALIEQIGEGFGFTEGPAWVPRGDGFLLFSDIPANTIFQWTPEGVTEFYGPVYEGDFEEGRLVGSNGIIIDPEGQIVFTEHFNGRISRVDTAGNRSTVVDNYEGGRLNSPNDLVYKSDGSLFFTDPHFGLPSPEAKELDVNGIYKLSPGGDLTLLADQPAPNGLAFSPDESRLYVADSMGKSWFVYEVAEDGTLSAGEIFFDASHIEAPGTADGLKVDAQGNLWATGPGGVWIISPDGQHLGTLIPPQPPANVAWGDSDGQTLYMTAGDKLYRIRVNVAGDGW